MRRLFAFAGIDYEQWRSLTATYLLLDLRRSGGARAKNDTSQDTSALAYVSLMVGALLNSASIALLVFLISDPLTASVLMVTMAGTTITMLVLLDFSGSVVSGDDYWVIAPRPVSSRTYFAARLAAVLAYVSASSLLMSLAPALVFLGWHQLGIGAFAGAIIATVLAGVAGTAVVIGLYTRLMARMRPARLVRAMSWMHIFASMFSMLGFLLMFRALDDARIRELSIGDLSWIWYAPPTWFGAIVPALAGLGGSREWLLAAVSAAITLVLLTLAAGRIDLEFALHLSEASAGGASARPRRLLDRIPGFSEGEAYAVATLIRAQFRHDLRFRLAVLGILPMTVFYLGLGWNERVLADPFTTGEFGGTPAYMALGFLPMLLHGALHNSDHWRASWIYWVTPCDPARLIVASKNFVTVFFIGTYLLLFVALWSTAYERVWHAVVHAAFVGTGAHLLLQGAVIVSPALPFAREPKRAEQSAGLFVLFFFGMLFTSVTPALLPFIYRRATWTIALAVVLAVVTVALERTLHRRARSYVARLELR